MTFNLPTMTVLGLLAIGCALSFPVLYKGFSRRGKGVVYESNFLIQRAPQLLSGVNVALLFSALASSMVSSPACLDSLQYSH
jgi:hypothetical protein